MYARHQCIITRVQSHRARAHRRLFRPRASRLDTEPWRDVRRRAICDSRFHARAIRARRRRSTRATAGELNMMVERSRGLTFGCFRQPSRARPGPARCYRVIKNKPYPKSRYCRGVPGTYARDDRSIALTDDEARVRVNNPKTDRSRACFV